MGWLVGGLGVGGMVDWWDGRLEGSRLMNWLVGWVADQMIGFWAGWLVGWGSCGLVGWWLEGWSEKKFLGKFTVDVNFVIYSTNGQ